MCETPAKIWMNIPKLTPAKLQLRKDLGASNHRPSQKKGFDESCFNSTLPETNSKRPWKYAVYIQKGSRILFQPHQFSGAVYLSLRAIFKFKPVRDVHGLLKAFYHHRSIWKNWKANFKTNKIPSYPTCSPVGSPKLIVEWESIFLVYSKKIAYS